MKQDEIDRHLGATVKYAPTKEEGPGEILAMVYDPEGHLTVPIR